MTKLLHRQSRGGNILLKIDMHKAYNRVGWWFLLHVLWSFGILNDLCKLVSVCVASSWSCIIVNGKYKCYFKPKRSLRQGDLFFPYLIIIEEVLSRMIKLKVAKKNMKLFTHLVLALTVSHLLYADDVVFFANVSKGNITCLIEILKTYENWTC